MGATSTRLREKLSLANPILLQETTAIVQTVTPFLWHSLSTFPTGTSHTPEHTQTVELIAGMLLSDDVISQLTADELQLLILACHFHDLGMAGTEFENSNPDRQQQARRDHAIRIGEIISQKWNELGFRDETIARSLGEVCRGHRPRRTGGIASWDDIREKGILAPGRTARLRLVSALIYAADELHIGSDRASKRSEEWLNLQNTESRKHWARHRCIDGPADTGTNEVLFICTPPTPFLENDLKANVLLKAFGAVRDANSQLKRDDIDGYLANISLEMNRDKLAKLALISLQADHKGRSKSELRNLIEENLWQEAEEQCDLGGLCQITNYSRECLGNDVDRVISDFEHRGFLVACNENEETLLLSPESHVASEILEIAKRADEFESVFKRPSESQQFEFSLLTSPYGHAFAKETLYPTVKSSFGVDLNTEQSNSSLLLVLRYSPSATKFLMERPPRPSLQVKRHELNQVVLAGASLDVTHNPNLLLNGSFRSSLKLLSNEVAARQQDFIKLSEELALLNGYSIDQVHEAMLPSDAASSELTRSLPRDETGVPVPAATISISQTVEFEASSNTLLFPYLVLAGSRCGIAVEFASSPDFPIKIAVDSKIEAEIPDSLISNIEFGPGELSLPEQADIRADFNIDEDLGEGRFLLTLNKSPERENCPIIVRLPLAEMKSGNPNPNFGFNFISPALTAGIGSAFFRLLDFAKDQRVTCKIIQSMRGKFVAEIKIPSTDWEQLATKAHSRELCENLQTISNDLPLPLFLSKSEITSAARSVVAAKELYKSYSQMAREEKRLVTSLTLQCSSLNGGVVKEEFLDFFPGIMFGPPLVLANSELPQEKVDALWNDLDESKTINASFTKDIYELSRAILDWAEGDFKEEFPLNMNSDTPNSPVFKSRFEVEIRPCIDRVWHLECPVILRLRPINQLEQWQVEREYWKAAGDQSRVELLSERIDETTKRTS